MALAAYRNLLRASQLAFQGDQPVLLAARQQIRQGFREKAALSPEDPALQPALDHAQQVARILRENVVQGQREGEDMYKLRIHEDIERGDNESIKFAGSGSTLGSGGCCGGSGGGKK